MLHLIQLLVQFRHTARKFIYDGHLVIEADGDEWSFAKTDDRGNVIEVAEKDEFQIMPALNIFF